MSDELSDAEWLEGIRRQNRRELGLDGPAGLTGGGVGLGTLGDFLYINPSVPGSPIPSPTLAPEQYWGAGSQAGTGRGFQYRRAPTTVTQLQPYPTFATQYVLTGGGQMVSGLGIGASGAPTAEQKAELTRMVDSVVSVADAYRSTGDTTRDGVQLAGARGGLEMATQRLASVNWTDRSWGFIGPAYSTRSELLQKLQEARVRLLARSGQVREDGRAMISSKAADPVTGKRVIQGSGNVYVDTALNYPGAVRDRGGELYKSASDFFGDAKKMFDTPGKMVGWAVVGLAVYAFATGAGRGLLSSGKKKKG